ncbi:MAG: asparagine synthase (glutamine-hydrolyzing) [bacterium]
MCGICGFVDSPPDLSAEELHACATRMSGCLRHRGPDDAGSWVDAEAGIALGHRRLSIIDLSPLGHQPMCSASGRYVIIFNGEIYNFKILRVELEGLGHGFRGRSDTEVMLAAFEQWGPLYATRRFNGMFAFALWDRSARCIYLARDRMGEKPLYYGWQGGTFLFASELKSLRQHPAFKNEINRDALALFMQYSYIPAPFSIYAGIFKLPPGTLLTLDFSTAEKIASARPRPVEYWSLQRAAQHGLLHTFTGTEQEAMAEFDALLRDAVKLRMEADVPLGAFLSGGVDSSTMVALMQAQSSRPVKTFTIGFHESGYDEATFARPVAQHLGTEHTELYVTPEETRAVIPRLPALYDEPFGDSSQIPTFLVAQLARRHVTVSLSGDGGDELFCGYRRYFTGQQLWNTVGWIPQAGRKALTRVLKAVPVKALNNGLGGLRSVTAGFSRRGEVGDKLHKFAEMLVARSADEFYDHLVSFWRVAPAVVIGATVPEYLFADFPLTFNLPDFPRRMMLLDALLYLPDDILAKVDRATMAVSLESRVPLLDHRVIEFAWRLPLRMKLRDGKSKWLLRQLLYQYVPPSLIERDKMGFGVPIDAWLRTPLREWAEALLNEQRLRQEGFFLPQPILRKWREHLSGQHEWQYDLWNVLMFQAWHEHWR